MASTVLHDDTDKRIATLKQRRDTIEAQIMRVITGGQSISAPGAMSISQVPITDLRRELERVKREILRLSGGSASTVVLPDFSGETEAKDVP